jgi:hypothetical protein
MFQFITKRTLLDEPAGRIGPNGCTTISALYHVGTLYPTWKKQDSSECSRASLLQKLRRSLIIVAFDVESARLHLYRYNAKGTVLRQGTGWRCNS